MDHDSLLKFARSAVYTGLICGLLYVLIPMDIPSLQPLLIKIVLQQLTILIIVALFLERALEVYKLSYFSQEKERLATKVEHLQVDLQTLLPQTEAKEGHIEEVKLSLFNAEEKLWVYKNHVRQRLLRAAIGFGLLIGLVGIRSLEGALDFPVPESGLEFFRFYLFRVLDLILTTGLIAGGSEGIHNIIKRLGDLLPSVSKKVIAFVRAINQEPV